MSISAAYAVNTKCRAMYARLLTRGDLDALLNMTGVPQVAAYLKKDTSYGEVLADIDENDVHRRTLEHILKKSLFSDYAKLLRFCSDDYKSGIQNMFLAYEVDDIKLLISSICANHRYMLGEDDLIYIRDHSELNAGGLLSAQTFDALAESLKGSRYHGLLAPFAGGGAPEFFDIDSAIDIFDYKCTMEGFKKYLRGAGRDIALEVYGTIIDITNIFFIYRLKKMKNSTIGDIITHLIPYYRKMRKAEFTAMAECEDAERLSGLISGSKYGFLFPVGNENVWEHNYYEYLYDTHRRNLRTHGYDIGGVMSYLFLKEIDIKNIIMVIEGVRYSLPAQETAALLIGYDPRRKKVDE